MKGIKVKNIFAKVEDRPTPSQVYNWRIYFTAMLASTASILIGYDSGFIGGTVANPHFLPNFGVKPNTTEADNTTANVISCFHAAAFFGALLGYPLAHYWGRRKGLIVFSAIGAIGAAVMIAAVQGHLAPMYIGRVLTGLTVGASTNLTVVYLSEVSPSPIRGQIVALYELGWRVGDLVGFWINYGVVEHVAPGNRQWLIPLAVQLIPAAMFCIASLTMVESPRWLFQVGRDSEAVKNLTWLRNLPVESEYVEWEINSIKESIDFQNKTVGTGILDPAKEVFIRNTKYFKRLGITCCLFLFQNFMGIQALNYYSVPLFKSLGVKGTNASLFSSGLFGVCKFICTFIYIFLIVDCFGRRIAFLVSSSFCTVFFWYIGAYLKVVDPTKPGVDPGPGGKAAIAMMYLWTCSFILAWSGGPFVWAAEVYEQNIRVFTQSLNAAVSWVPIFIMTRLTTNMVKSMHYGIFFFFASIALLSIPFVFFFVPETKGIPLEEIDKLFHKGIPARRAHGIVSKQLMAINDNKINGSDGSRFDLEDNPKKGEELFIENASGSTEDEGSGSTTQFVS
ncbi:hypothetical protein HG537_0D00170 [Torulaspora globosa]|uniref:Quinate transporter n=1 Tax=Torulaspora globosa TaxID=48254 RepID=A0A7H9HTI1_9SACH|nr:hypothetical protein HG537_0D00170 [Torulaspora sp. CBS 2947]